MIDSSNVCQIRRKIRQATAHRSPRRRRIESVRRHPGLLRKACIWVFEVNLRDAVTTAGECRAPPVIHAEQSSLLTALVHLLDEVEEIRFSAAKRIVVLVAIQNAHDHRPIEEYAPGIGQQMREDFAGGYK